MAMAASSTNMVQISALWTAAQVPAFANGLFVSPIISHHHCRRCQPALHLRGLVSHQTRLLPPSERNTNSMFMVQSQDEEIGTKLVTTDATPDPPIVNGEDTPSILEKESQADITMQPKVESTDVIDDLWTWALQTPTPDKSEKQTQRTTAHMNNKRRMQMFAYLSQPIVEVQIIGLVVFSCFLVAVYTLQELPSGLRQGISFVDTFCVYIFAVEFFLRWWSAGRFQLRYLAKPLVSIDAIVVILPLLLSGLLPVYDLGVMAGVFPHISLPTWLLASTSSANSALLNLRLLRVLKFQKVLTDENTYMRFEMALGMKKTDVRPYQLQLARVLVSLFTLVSVSTGLIYTAEHEVNPQIPDYFTALYFGLTTLTTVGFGDITPVTFQGRLVVGGSILAGVAIIPAQAASLAEAYLDFQKERNAGKVMKPTTVSKTRKSMRKCDNCGSGPHRRDAVFCWSCGESLED